MESSLFKLFETQRT